MFTSDFHILVVNETKPDSEISDNLLEIRGSTLHREDRSRNRGGVAVYVWNSFKPNRPTDTPDSSLELVCIETEPVRARPFLCSHPSDLHLISFHYFI